MEESANKLHFKCADFNSSTHVTAYAECIYVFLLKSCTCLLYTSDAADE